MGTKRPASDDNNPFTDVDKSCWDNVVPFEARFLEALELHKVSAPSEFQSAVAKAFEEIDTNDDGCIDRQELEALVRQKIYPTCPERVWSVTPDQLLEKLKLGGAGQRVSRSEFVTAVESMADTLDSRVWPLASSQLLSALVFAVNQPLMPLLVRELGIDMTSFGCMVALMPLVRVMLSFPATFAANEYGRMPLLVQGQLVAALGFTSAAFVGAPWQLALSRAVVGVGTNFAAVGQQNMLADISTGRTRSRVFAPGSMLASAAFTVGPTAGGFLAATIGVKNTYLIVGGGMAFISIANRYLLTETLRTSGIRQTAAPKEPGWWDMMSALTKDRPMKAVMLASAGYNFTSIASKFTLLPMLALDTWGLGSAELGLAMGAMSLVQFASARPAGYIADVYGRQAALIPGLGLTAMSMGLAALGDSSLPVLSTICAGWALGTSLVGSAPSALAIDAAGRLKLDQKGTAQALALMRLVGDLGMAAGCLTSGLLLSYVGAPSAFAAQAWALTVITGVSALAMRKL